MSNFKRVIEKWRKEKGPLRILSASGQLGYGIAEKAFRAGLERDLHMHIHLENNILFPRAEGLEQGR